MVIFFLLFFHATLTASQQESVDYFNTLPDELVIPIIYNLTATRVKPTDVSHLAITNKRFNTILSDPAVVEMCVSIIMRTKNVDAMDAMVSLGTRCDEWWEQYLKKNRKEIFRNQMRNLLFCKYAKREQSPARLATAIDFHQRRFFQPQWIDGIKCDDGTFLIITSKHQLAHYDTQENLVDWVDVTPYGAIEKQKGDRFLLINYTSGWHTIIKRICESPSSLQVLITDTSFSNDGLLMHPIGEVHVLPDDSIRILGNTEIITYDPDGKKELCRMARKK